MARTILDEELKERPELIDHQLSHAVRDPNGRAYNRTSYLEERRQMMQRWADYLDSLWVCAATHLNSPILQDCYDFPPFAVSATFCHK